MIESQALPTRQTTRVETDICREEGCFVAIPGDQKETHAKWHERKRKMNS